MGTGHVHPAVLEAVRASVAEARAAGEVLDAYAARCGDDLLCVLLHDHGPDAAVVRELGRRAFARSGGVAAGLAQHDVPVNGGLRVDATDLLLEGRPSEPVLCFAADKAGPGAWNVHLYRAFADPFNTPRLLTDPLMADGFRFVVLDRLTGATDRFDLPDDLHGFLRVVAGSDRFVVREVVSRATGCPAAVTSIDADPTLLVRCHGGLPTVGEVLEAFAFPYAVTGWTDGRPGPLMPVATTDEACSRSDGPPRAIGLGFQVSTERLVGPRDLLADRAFDEVRRQALVAADYLRRHGPFAPRRAPEDSWAVPVPGL